MRKKELSKLAVVDCLHNDVGRNAVSYTHLDVYKRQIMGKTTIEENLMKNGFHLSTVVGTSMMPVSYTHLDVYKRQVL